MYLRVVCLVDWHLEVFYCPYYKIKNARMHELNFMHPNIYYRTIFVLKRKVDTMFNQSVLGKYHNFKLRNERIKLINVANKTKQ